MRINVQEESLFLLDSFLALFWHKKKKKKKKKKSKGERKEEEAKHSNRRTIACGSWRWRVSDFGIFLHWSGAGCFITHLVRPESATGRARRPRSNRRPTGGRWREAPDTPGGGWWRSRGGISSIVLCMIWRVRIVAGRIQIVRVGMKVRWGVPGAALGCRCRRIIGSARSVRRGRRLTMVVVVRVLVGLTFVTWEYGLSQLADIVRGFRIWFSRLRSLSRRRRDRSLS